MANAKGKSIDKTHLSIDAAEKRGLIHRDYIAHCFRWSHVVKYLMQKGRHKTAVVLDIGCGKEVPLAKLLYSNKLTSTTYIGCDVNKLDVDFNFGSMSNNIILVEKCDFAKYVSLVSGKQVGMNDDTEPKYVNLSSDSRSDTLQDQPNIITCFEVLEHVEPAHSVRLLQKMREVIHDDGTIFISTPCFNGNAAGNHVNEITYEALGTLIQTLGFGIRNVYGTFASQSDIEPLIEEYNTYNTDGLVKAYRELKKYYDSNVISTFLAPLFPQASRNCLWELTKHPQEDQDLIVFPTWEELQEPWTSSELWKELKPE